MSCVKCGSDDIRTAWHKDGYECTYGQRKVDGGFAHSIGEHLHRTCQNCHYPWKEPVLGSDGWEK